MQVTAAPVSNSHEKVLSPALTASLGLILSPLKGVIISNSLLQVAIEMVHKLRINCGMMLEAWMRGVIRLFIEKLAAVSVDLSLVSHIHFRPVGTSLFVFARFIVFNSLPAFFLSVVLDFAIEAILPISVPVVSISGIVSVAALS
jgi:hypothetical protein